ncbi:hypothetical protein D9619_012569 [Psilocybe cf. subviscida]|uniref:F-box domain-containing protein n=1 Tax=Psilocybe cf. subviscida TaxID=2480587 RepID=A0A8H5EYZ0_9AGAR|nr:hypothetical protein D9619_012569 [Psilocybe cf. subviscida]
MVPDIPYDVFLQIFESCSDSKDVVSLGGVCAQWREFFDTRDVWAMLVSRFLDRRPSPRLHYVEISSYRDKDSVKNLYRRLKLSEMAWKVAGDYETKVEKLDLDPGCCAKTSILSPGGRFLIVFTNLIQAFCFDLDSRSPRPIAIIPAQIQTMSHYLPEGTDQTSDELAHEIQVEVSAPDIDSTAENLSFRAVVTYGARYHDSTAQVWQFDSVFDDATGQSSLTAFRLLSWAPGYGFLRCRSFLGNKLVLEAPYMDVGPGLPSGASKFLIFNWRKASENPSDFPLRTLFTYTSVELVQLLKVAS